MPEDGPTNTEMMERERRHLLATEDEVDPEHFPLLYNLSPAFIFQFVLVRTPDSTPPEYVYVRTHEDLGLKGDDLHRHRVFLTEWNSLWEAGSERTGILREDIPASLDWLMDLQTDVRLVPRDKHNRYHAYTALFHLLPHSTLQRFGLPLLQRGLWPFWQGTGEKAWLPADFDERLERAVSYHLWPLLARGAPSAFADDEPIRLLSHNLDFWIPFADMVAQERMRAHGRVPMGDGEQRRLYEERRDQMPPDISLERPLRGGAVWYGESEAWEATKDMVRLADEHGRLRSLIEAVRAHRVEEDFTDRWSYEREDFERKLFRKRAAVKVRFVELDDTVPVHGPESEVHEHLLWEDFFAILDAKEREIVVCLRSGVTKVGAIANRLGYANHSPISKKLARIRKKAEQFFELT
jgi:hypothetical protein